MSKTPKAKHLPVQDKTPRKAGFDENPMRLRPAWRFGRMEYCDPWGWHEVDEEMMFNVRDRLISFESMPWGDIIRDTGSHPVRIDRLVKDAQERLDALRLDDLEELFSLRITGVRRVWGIMEHNVLILLWWDPEHEVCPSLKS